MICWECESTVTALAEDHPLYPIHFCFNCGSHFTVDIEAIAQELRA